MKNNALRVKYYLILVPIIIAWGIIPLIVRTHMYNPGISQFEWAFWNETEYLDIFMFWKAMAAVTVGVVMTIVLICEIIRTKNIKRLSKWTFLLAGYILLVLISFFASDYKNFSNAGTLEMFDSTWVIISYAVFTLYAYFMLEDERQIKLIVYITAAFVLLEILICLGQQFGYQVFRQDWYLKLVLDSDIYPMRDQLEINCSGNFGTLYNQDHVGLYTGVFIPVFASMVYLAKKWWLKALWAILTIGLVVITFTANATGGVVALIAGAMITVVLIACKTRKSRIISLVSLGLVIIAALIFINTEAGAGIKREFLGTRKYSQTDEINSLVCTDKAVEFHFKNGTLYMEGDSNSLVFRDDESTYDYIYDYEQEMFRVNLSDKYPEISFIPIQSNDEYENVIYGYELFFLDSGQWIFSNEFADGRWHFLNSQGKWAVPEAVESADIFNDDAFSDRGIIWNRTMPVLKKHILVGSGANTFLTEYPQADYAYSEIHNQQTTINVKAHNWLLHTMVEEGVLAVLLFLAFYIWYLISTVRTYLHADPGDSKTWLMMAFMSGTIIYMIGTLVNDSLVVTAPVFWIALGLGLALNRMVANQVKAAAELEK